MGSTELKDSFFSDGSPAPMVSGGDPFVPNVYDQIVGYTILFTIAFGAALGLAMLLKPCLRNDLARAPRAALADSWRCTWTVFALLARLRRNRQVDLEDYAHAGLDDSVKASLPTFLLDSKKAGTDCVVCFEVFKKKEKVLLLPKCKHSFHIDCIFMWFQSHSTCPTCRCSVTPDPQSSYSPNVLIRPIPLPREGVHHPELHISVSTA